MNFSTWLEFVKPTAVIIKGNPKFIDNEIANKFYSKLKNLFNILGYSVLFDSGEPYTSPPVADVWVGHSRGADRLRFAPSGVKTIAIGSSLPGAINHPKDDVDTKFHFSGEMPPRYHFKLTKSMIKEIMKQLP